MYYNIVKTEISFRLRRLGMTLQEQISENIKAEILSSDKTKSQIAAEIGVSKPTLSQYLSGRIQPSLLTFAKLCKVLGASADDILGLTK